MKARELLGIPADRWADFFKSYSETTTIAELEDINGIGPGTAETFEAQGYASPKAVESILIDALSEFEGIGPSTAEDILNDLANVRMND